MTFTADTTTVDANSAGATLTATVDNQLYGPYVLSIWDDASGQRLAYCWDGPTQCSTSVKPANKTAKSYTAYVSYGTSTPPTSTSGIKAQSSIWVVNTGWMGSVELTTSIASADADSPAAQLTATTDRPLAGGYILSLYDMTTGQRLTYCSTAGTTTCTYSTFPPYNQSHLYRAYVCTCLTADPPDPTQYDVPSTSTVGITNRGWHGRLVLTSDRTSVDADHTSVVLTASASKPVNPNVWLSIYDSTSGALLAYCHWTKTCTATVSPGTSGTRTYTAYVAGNWPNPGPPFGDIRGKASITVSAGTVSDQETDDLSMAKLGSLLAGTSTAAIELALNEFPGRTYFLRGTESDQGLVFAAAIAAGATTTAALLQAADASNQYGGGDDGTYSVPWWVMHSFTPQPFPIPVPSADPVPPSVSDAWPEIGLGDALIAKNPGVFSGLSDADAKALARDLAGACLAYTSDAGRNGFSACQTLPIFLPGADMPTTTEHIITALSEDARWVLLNYEVGETKLGNRQWYLGQPDCSADKKPSTDYQCDEYPYWASEQGGEDAQPTPHVQWVYQPDDHSRQGNRYSTFLGACHMDGRPQPGAHGDAFLNVPLPPALGIWTLSLCNGH